MYLIIAVVALVLCYIGWSNVEANLQECSYAFGRSACLDRYADTISTAHLLIMIVGTIAVIVILHEVIKMATRKANIAAKEVW